MKISCYSNDSLSEHLREENLCRRLSSDDVMHMYLDYLGKQYLVKTPVTVNEASKLLHRFFKERFYDEQDESSIHITFLNVPLGIAKNGMLLNGLTMLLNSDYHIVLSSSIQKIDLEILLHEMIHVYHSCLIPYDKASADNIESEVESLEENIRVWMSKL